MFVYGTDCQISRCTKMFPWSFWWHEAGNIFMNQFDFCWFLEIFVELWNTFRHWSHLIIALTLEDNKDRCTDDDQGNCYTVSIFLGLSLKSVTFYAPSCIQKSYEISCAFKPWLGSSSMSFTKTRFRSKSPIDYRILAESSKLLKKSKFLNIGQILYILGQWYA